MRCSVDESAEHPDDGVVSADAEWLEVPSSFHRQRSISSPLVNISSTTRGPSTGSLAPLQCGAAQLQRVLILRGVRVMVSAKQHGGQAHGYTEEFERGTAWVTKELFAVLPKWLARPR